MAKTATTEKDKGYLFDCLQNANWLVKSLDQRARTILKVAEQIVRQQDSFFMYGVQYLRPLNLKAIADAISMHELTVSRVTSNKYIATTRGIFELKYFFTRQSLRPRDGEAHSSESVRHRIKQMIDAEQAAYVLSDDQLRRPVKKRGYRHRSPDGREIPGGDANSIILYNAGAIRDWWNDWAARLREFIVSK